MKRLAQTPKEEPSYDLGYMLPTSTRQITVTDFTLANQDFMDVYFPQISQANPQERANKKKRYEWRLVQVEE